jgi:F-type H+-transporting ATPase subunit a
MTFKNIVKSILFICAVVLSMNTSFANGHKGKEDKGAFIMHHIKDAHEWHVFGPEHGHGSVSVYLPIILVDGGFKVFSSKHLYHGEVKTATDKRGKVLEFDYIADTENGYGLFHEKIYKLNEEGNLIFKGEEVINAKPLDLSITKNTLSLFFGATIILLLMFATAKFYRKNGAVAPKGLAKFIEPLIVFVRDDVAKANIPHGKHVKYTPYLLTIFFFIFFNNLLGLVPIIPGGANLTGSISVTLVLATFTLLITIFSGNKNYWKHIFATPGVPIALLPIMIPIEIVGVFTKPFALMIRLFANMTAGHVIILSLISIIFINQSAAWGLLSVPMGLFISVLELLVAFLQAYLFAMLSALFISAAIEEAHH